MILQRLKYNNIPELKLNTLQLEMRNQITAKLSSQVYKMESINCPVCNTDHFETIGEKDRYGLHYQTNICINCGLVCTNPRMDQNSYNSYYNLEYRKLYVGSSSATEDFFYSQQNRGKKIYDLLMSKNLIADDSSKRILEVGCGAGGILEVFKQKGHKTKGIDLGQEYIKFGIEKYQLDLKYGFLSDLVIDEKPDVIIYSHVFEHILDLNSELQLIKKIATKNTIIYIEVPGIKEVHLNYKSNILLYFQNSHTFNFSLESLSNVFNKHGFKLIYGNQYVQSIYKLDASQVKTVSNDYNSIKDYIINTENNIGRYKFSLHSIKLFLTRKSLRFLDFFGLRKFARRIHSLIFK